MWDSQYTVIQLIKCVLNTIHAFFITFWACNAGIFLAVVLVILLLLLNIYIKLQFILILVILLLGALITTKAFGLVSFLKMVRCKCIYFKSAISIFMAIMMTNIKLKTCKTPV